jgi:hypothetical protein
MARSWSDLDEDAAVLDTDRIDSEIHANRRAFGLARPVVEAAVVLRALGCWGSVSGGQPAPGSKVTAVRWTDQQFALFVVDSKGDVYTIGGTPWGGWGSVSGPGSWALLPNANTTASSGIAAIKWPGGTTNELAIFTTRFDGSVEWNLGDPQQGFQGWIEVDNPFQAAFRAPVTAVPYGGDPPNRAALFVTDPQGAIYAALWVP